MFPCGGTCLPVNNCWCIRVEERVYQWTIVDVSVWRNVSTSELLLMFPCGGTCLPTRSSTRKHQQSFTGRHVPPHGYINNRSLVATFLHTETSTIVHWWTRSSTRIHQQLFTSERLLMYPCGGTCLPVNYCWCFRVEERVYQWTIVDVSVWRNHW
jgi:hypothetical protein